MTTFLLILPRRVLTLFDLNRPPPLPLLLIRALYETPKLFLDFTRFFTVWPLSSLVFGGWSRDGDVIKYVINTHCRKF